MDQIKSLGLWTNSTASWLKSLECFRFSTYPRQKFDDTLLGLRSKLIKLSDHSNWTFANLQIWSCFIVILKILLLLQHHLFYHGEAHNIYPITAHPGLYKILPKTTVMRKTSLLVERVYIMMLKFCSWRRHGWQALDVPEKGWSSLMTLEATLKGSHQIRKLIFNEKVSLEGDPPPPPF